MPTLAKDLLPPSKFHPSIHPHVDSVAAEVDDYFLRNWPFRSEKERAKFRAAGFSRVTCLYFPLAMDDRIGFACRLLTVLFLIDDLLEEMGLDEGSEYNEKLISISRGEIPPDRNIPVEWIMHDLWEDVKACDAVLGEQIMEPVFTFMRAQTDKSRLAIHQLGEYLEYREKDVGQALLSALQRYTMKIHLTEEDLRIAAPVERNCAKHIAVLNDIYSWNKELLASETLHHEGAAICSSVQVLSEETALNHAAAQRVLWTMCREWESVHRELVREREEIGCKGDLLDYIHGLEYQMSGNERWSESTPRYHF
ncbi:uncharacterized protein N7458_001736 [Penicillium daleae]|uniref:Terpene synthase n=1 Tax=Penicillium daleae TaxID=63821 RepID=A0AAD6CBK2_9EURO|nr:uncharacterized protein N7458_001736 [Penicillium daleae]KAJ5460184.1 hypothetical protein N7458_001736 [Penicillium daleae]